VYTTQALFAESRSYFLDFSGALFESIQLVISSSWIQKSTAYPFLFINLIQMVSSFISEKRL